jgi:hypothetical protein
MKIFMLIQLILSVQALTPELEESFLQSPSELLKIY